MAWGHSICKTVIFSSVFGLLLLVLTDFCLPPIFDYLWQLPTSPAKSLEGILAHRIALKNLETELNTVLHATNHPVNDHGIAGYIEISQQYDEYFEMVEDYTKEYGKLQDVDFDRFIGIHAKISNKLSELSIKDEELNVERLGFIAGLAQRVADTTEPTLKLIWTLSRQLDKMAEFGLPLDKKQTQVDVENANLGLVSNSEDETCIKLLQKLSKLLDEVDDIEMRTEMIELFMANKKLLGKTFLFVTAATVRVRNLVLEVVEKEDVWIEELNSALMELRDMVYKSNHLTESLLSNMKLRIAPDLDQEL